MANPSNLYAEKIFAEHPSALFTLDDNIDYLSIISEANRNLTTWTPSASVSASEVGILAQPKRPVDNFVVYRVSVPEPSSTTSNPDATATLSLGTFDIPIGGFSAGIYVFFTNPYFKTITFKATATNTYTESYTLNSSQAGSWVFISKTLITPAMYGATLSIEIGYDKNTVATDDYEIYLSGYTAGQYAEEFNSSSFGASSTAIPGTVAFGNTYAWTGTVNLSTSTKTNANGSVKTNYIKQPNFESATTGWSVRNGTVATSTTSQYVGTRSALFTVGSSGQTAGINCSPNSTYMPPVTPGQVVTYSIYVKDVDTAKSYRSYIDFYDATPTFITGSGVNGTTTTVSTSEWTRVTVTATVPSGAAYARPYTYSTTTFAVGDAGKTVYFDAAMFEISSTASEFFDGNTADDSYIEAKAYGLGTDSGYYLVNKNVISARNASVPMVYGSGSSTVISENLSGEASLIVPAYGFLNEIGQYNKTTFEMWLRINPKTTSATKIFGPLSTTDGLYVDGPFLIYKVGNNIISHFVGEWGRPMLVQLCLSPDNMSMFLNGEQISSKTIDMSEITFAQSEVNSKDNNFVGFYSTSEIGTYELDCVAIYPYQINQVLSLRRYGYAQAVDFPTKSVKAYAGKAAVFDYPFAKYVNNHNYGSGSKNNWKQGYSDNTQVAENILKTPSYELPSFVFAEGTFKDFIDSTGNQTQTETVNSFSLKPSGWTRTDESGYILIENLDILNDQAKIIYGVFKAVSADSSSGVPKTLIRLENDYTEDYLEITYEYGSVYYKTSIAGTVTTLKTVSSIAVGDLFAVGLDIDVLTTAYPAVKTLLGNSSLTKIYIGGNKDLDSADTFAGKIYSIGIGTGKSREIAKAATSTLFDSNGIMSDTDANYAILQTLTSSYTLVSRTIVGRSYIDISTSSRWQDYVPLQSLAKYVKDSSGNDYYELDFVQFNVNYPPSLILSGTNIDTSNSKVKTYVSFQSISSGANADLDSLTTISATANGIHVPATGWATKKYEVIDGTVVYMPTDGGYSLDAYALAIHMTIESDGVINTPISVRSLQIAPKSLNDVLENPVGTRFGTDVIPYTYSSGSYNYKTQNEFKIYKGSSPHLYLSNQSGISMIGNYDSGTNRGLQINLNEELLNPYKISSVQITMKFDLDEFSTTAATMLEIYNGTSSVTFTIDSNGGDNSRGIISSSSTDVEFFLNGKLVANPIVSLRQWNTIGIRFKTLFSFAGSEGYFRIKYPMLVNNVSFYQATANQELTIPDVTYWYEVEYPSGVGTTWGTVDNQTWGYYVTSGSTTTKVITISPEEIYKSFTGTNKIVFDSNTSYQLKVGDYEYKSYSDTFKTTTILPAT
jgi:hypothetical protein